MSVHSASVKLATSIALSELVSSLYRPAVYRNLEHMRALQAELSELKGKQPRDLEAEHELIKRHPEARPNCLGCVAPLALTDCRDLRPGALVTAQPDPAGVASRDRRGRGLTPPPAPTAPQRSIRIEWCASDAIGIR